MLGVAVAALIAASAGGAMAAGSKPLTSPMSMSDYYFSVFGGGAFGTGSVSGWAHEVENVNYSNSWFEFADFNGNVGSGWLLGAAIGKHLTPSTRVELELSHASLDTKMVAHQANGNRIDYNNYNNVENSGSNTVHDRLNATFLLANLWYDFENGSKITPYIGGGAGFAYVSGRFRGDLSAWGDPVSYFNMSVDSWVPAFQVGAGAKIALTNAMDLDVGYRFKLAADIPVKTQTDAEVNFGNEYADYGGTKHMTLGVHVFQAGLTFHF